MITLNSISDRDDTSNSEDIAKPEDVSRPEQISSQEPSSNREDFPNTKASALQSTSESSPPQKCIPNRSRIWSTRLQFVT
jgi:RNA recognition motif-containing protein